MRKTNQFFVNFPIKMEILSKWKKFYKFYEISEKCWPISTNDGDNVWTKRKLLSKRKTYNNGEEYNEIVKQIKIIFKIFRTLSNN